ncbi:MAG: outer membrane protein assembly factor BamA [Calditrichia bacterium]|nr:outer membrane protein assembly factor BamA [Calditrichia bacterium]
MKSMYYILLALLLILLIAVEGYTQPQKFKINNIRIEGNERADSSIIILNSGLRPGKEITSEDIQKAVKNLWSLKLFSDVKIFVEKQTYSGLDLLIRLEEFPRLDGWVVEGNDKLKKKDIDTELQFYKGMVLTPFKIYKGKRNLIKKYKEEGYLLAQVNIDTVYRNKYEVLAEVKIDEGQKVQVKQIRIFGNKYLTENELKKQFSGIKEDRWWRGADFNEKKYHEDLSNLLNYCRKKGFRDAEIVKDSIYYSENKKDMFIDIYINENQQYYFGKVTFDGNTVFSDAELRAQLLFNRGDIYNQEEFEKSIRENIQNLYYNQGYLFANIQPLEIPAGVDTVDINLRVNEGSVVRIKEIIITGNTKTNEKVVRRELKIYPGDTFNRARLERSVRDVWVLNFFANVVPDVKLIEGDDKHINLEVNVEEKSTDTANMSAGYSQRDGMIGSIGLALNNFSLAHPLGGGDGQRLAFDWYFGRYYRSVSLSFTEPWTFNTPTLTGFSLFNTRSGGGFYPWDRTVRGGSVQLGRRFQWPDNYFRGDWILRVAETKIFNIRDPELLDSYIFYDRPTTQISLTQIIQRDSRNRPEFPTQGTVYSLMTELSGGPLQGDEDYLKNIFTVEWYIPTFAGFVLYTQSKLGVISGLHKNFYINPGELFYMGGSGLSFSEGLRGYDEGVVGPISASGQPLGGQSMFKFSAEFRIPIAPNPVIFGLFFLEAGNVWATFDETNLQDLRRGIGFGVRLFMPMIGIIGVDFGYGVDYFTPRGFRTAKWKTHFQFGRF